MNRQPSGEELRAWRKYIDAFGEYSEAVRTIFAPGVDRASLVRSALEVGGMDKNAAIHLLPHLRPDDLKALFELLVDWCATGHSVSPIFRDAIVRLPREWVVERIESVAEPLLAVGSDEEYRRILELYSELDHDLASRLARKAAQVEDPDISEAGREFLEHLGRIESAGSPVAVGGGSFPASLNPSP